MPFADGSFYRVVKENGKELTKVPISTEYSINALVPIAAINGTSEAHSLDEEDTGENKQVITFTSGEESSYDIILQFNNKGTIFTITPEPEPQDVIPLGTIFLLALQNFLQSNVLAINFRLAGINNYMPASGQTLLTPKSFAFSVCADGEASGLSLFIQTEQSKNDPGNANPSF